MKLGPRVPVASLYRTVGGYTLGFEVQERENSWTSMEPWEVREMEVRGSHSRLFGIQKGQSSHASILTFLRKGFRIGHEFRDCKCCLGFVAGVSFGGVGELCGISHCQPLPVCHF